MTCTREHRRSGESGFGLIEVVVSASILLIVTLGTLSLIDRAQGRTVETQGRTVAAQLAEQEQENLRSTRVSELAGIASGGRTGFTRTRSPITVNGIAYSVTSTGTWLRDATGTAPTCTDSGVAEYLRLRTTVTDVSGADGAAPVTITSILTPQVGAFGEHVGTLGVQVFGRDGTTPLSGLNVTATSSAQTGTQATNAAGCALFQYYASGDYVASFTRPGYVDVMGRNPGQVSGKVVDGSMTVVTQRFAQAGSVKATVATAAGVTPQAYGISLANSGITNATGTRTAPATLPASPGSVFQATGLFPFVTGYAAYAGVCTANSPTNYGATAPLVTVDPGAVDTPVTVTVPAMTVTVKKNISGTITAVSNPVVRATAVDTTNCGAGSYSFPTNSSTGTPKLGLPYGPYSLYVCGNVSGTLRYTTVTATNNGSTGSTPTVTLSSSNPSRTTC